MNDVRETTTKEIDQLCESTPEEISERSKELDALTDAQVLMLAGAGAKLYEGGAWRGDTGPLLKICEELKKRFPR